jgi:hypothetical protein
MKNLKPEESFQSAVIVAAHMQGWKVAHFRPAMTKSGKWITAVGGDGKGFPDLFMVHPLKGLRVAAELKIPPNTVTPEQDAWLTWMEICGIPAFTWTPADWDEINRVLVFGV